MTSITCRSVTRMSGWRAKLIAVCTTLACLLVKSKGNSRCLNITLVPGMVSDAFIYYTLTQLAGKLRKVVAVGSGIADSSGQLEIDRDNAPTFTLPIRI